MTTRIKPLHICIKCSRKTERKVYCQSCADDPVILTKRELRLVKAALLRIDGPETKQDRHNNHRELMAAARKISDYIVKTIGTKRDPVEWAFVLRRAAHDLEVDQKPFMTEGFHREQIGAAI